jgi:hypothetical protein
MGSGNASTKSKKYRGPTNNSTSKTSLSLSAASISKRKSNDAVARAARAQRKQQALHLRCNVAQYFCTELSPSELAEIRTLRDPPAQEDADWEMSDDMLGGVLNGHQLLDISHEGGEFAALTNLGQGLRKE